MCDERPELFAAKPPDFLCLPGLPASKFMASSSLVLTERLWLLAARTCCEVGNARGAAWNKGLALLDLIQVSSFPSTKNVTRGVLVAILVLGH